MSECFQFSSSSMLQHCFSSIICHCYVTLIRHFIVVAYQSKMASLVHFYAFLPQNLLEHYIFFRFFLFFVCSLLMKISAHLNIYALLFLVNRAIQSTIYAWPISIRKKRYLDVPNWPPAAL